MAGLKVVIKTKRNKITRYVILLFTILLVCLLFLVAPQRKGDLSANLNFFDIIVANASFQSEINTTEVIEISEMYIGTYKIPFLKGKISTQELSVPLIAIVLFLLGSAYRYFSRKPDGPISVKKIILSSTDKKSIATAKFKISKPVVIGKKCFFTIYSGSQVVLVYCLKDEAEERISNSDIEINETDQYLAQFYIEGGVQFIRHNMADPLLA